MLRRRAPRGGRRAGRPRTRGDAPPMTATDVLPASSAPHPRGCSPAHAPCAPVSGVGPAPAGMLRRRPRRPDRWTRRPRTRGDAPYVAPYADRGGESAPHPRGCSAAGAVSEVPGAVGPAPAGMLPASSRPR
ncbi:hypothetical protein B591_30858 (plasmid) [Streptomyces sp. GBA 94-10 4N24]|nr:hypothetical protein B591_30858 [Streptomyces sp. GBA 94-10 4N24]UZN63151.1 hypothetical protein B591N_30858 [Streptomyces sp. GBA 94-10 4N24]